MNINELYHVARKGDRDSENRLFKSLTESFRLFAQQRIWNDQDAEEIVQDTLVTVAEKYGNIQFEISFAAWAYRVLENKILNYYRGKHYQENRFTWASDVGGEWASNDSDPSLKRQLLDCLGKINRVHSRHARILNLRYQGYSAEEICEKLAISRNNLYILLCRARSMLKLCLEKGDIK
ncbi:MAG: RNA polymerase sigma factor [candidate division Zixibacteria bacterium]|nr:RNA polymerase sigma factor [candidate division Zixibacteria bacterium]